MDTSLHKSNNMPMMIIMTMLMREMILITMKMMAMIKMMMAIIQDDDGND